GMTPPVFQGVRPPSMAMRSRAGDVGRTRDGAGGRRGGEAPRPPGTRSHPRHRGAQDPVPVRGVSLGSTPSTAGIAAGAGAALEVGRAFQTRVARTRPRM